MAIKGLNGDFYTEKQRKEMPTYVYRHLKPVKERFGCPNEGKFEVKQSIKDGALTHCPDCGTEVERVLQAVPFKAPIWNKQTDILDDAEKVM